MLLSRKSNCLASKPLSIACHGNSVSWPPSFFSPFSQLLISTFFSLRVPVSQLFPPLARCPVLLIVTTEAPQETHNEKLDTKREAISCDSFASPLRYTYIRYPLADAADSCSLITSPVCCRVTLAGCILRIIFVHRTEFSCVNLFFCLFLVSFLISSFVLYS